MTATQAQAQQTLVLATRGSPLAVSQSQWVADQVEQALPGIRVELSTITTQGDVILDRPLLRLGARAFSRRVWSLHCWKVPRIWPFTA